MRKDELSEMKISTKTNDWYPLDDSNIEVTNLNEMNLNIEKHLYIVYKEKICKFDNPPHENRLPFEANEDYIFEYYTKGSESAVGTLYFIGYSDNKKIQVEVINPNEKKVINIDKDCKSYRLAIKLTGTGVFKIEDINIMKREKIDYSIKENSTPTIFNKKSLKEINMACIIDNFTEENLKFEVNLIKFTPYNFIEVLNNKEIDILFVESAWHGNNNSWEYKVGNYNNKIVKELTELISYCNLRNIPTVFWNKEDPVHFNKFIQTALLFDYIFTTDVNMVKEYKKLANHNNVFTMLFAAQPQLHNPIKEEEKIFGACFAGSYYGNRHEDRKRDMHDLLDICKDYNLTIYDRNYIRNLEDDSLYTVFPKEYQPYIVGSVDYKDMGSIYKKYKITINMNSVKNSRTMYSRRVYESLACGTPVVSNYSDGIEFLLKDIVIQDKQNNIKEEVEKLFKDNKYYREKSLDGIREVLKKHTYEDRLIEMLAKMNVEIPKIIPKISCIGIINNEDELEKYIRIYNSLIYQNKELVLIINSKFNNYIEVLNTYNTEEISCYIGKYVTEKYDSIKDIVKGEYVSYLSTNNEYGTNYLLDLSLGLKYSQCEVIGKGSYYKNIGKDTVVINEDKEYKFIEAIKIDRCIIKTDLLKGISVLDLLNSFRNKAYIKNTENIKEVLDSEKEYNDLFYNIIKRYIVRNQDKEKLNDYNIFINTKYFSCDNSSFIENRIK